MSKVIKFNNTNAYKDKRVQELANNFVYELRKVIVRYKRAFDTIDYDLLIKYEINLNSKNKKERD